VARAKCLVDNANRLTYFDGGVVLLDNLGMSRRAARRRAAAVGDNWSSRPTARSLRTPTARASPTRNEESALKRTD
jgi:hypothetical protein